MNFKLGKFTNEKNAFPKSYNWTLELSGYLKNPSNIVNPTIVVECDNPTALTYAYISSFGRYYFIENCVSVRTNLWEINLKCDVLQSFRTQIMSYIIQITN